MEKRTPLLPVLICSGLSAAMMHSSFLSFFSLAPLGYIAAVHTQAAWFTVALAVVTKCVFSLALFFYYRSGSLWIDILFFAALAAGFTWIMAGGREGRLLHIRTACRLIIVSAAGALAFLFFVLGSRNNSDLNEIVKAQADLLSSVIVSSSGADAVRRSFLEQTLTPEKLLEAFRGIVLRGGALFSFFSLFLVNRQLAITATWIIKKRRTAQNLSAFHAPDNTIWFLSFSLAVILLARTIKMEIPEIAAWNVLVVCAILFLGQGAGIVLFILARRTMPPVLRLVFNVLIIIVIFSPAINTIALAALLLLGIAENWLPLRAPKQDGPTSTPGL